MTYPDAKAKIIELVQAIEPTRVGDGFGAGFTHVPELMRNLQRLARARAFGLRHFDSSRLGPYTTGRIRMARGMELFVVYPRTANDDLRDTVIAEDHTAISQALLDDDAWDTEASSIVEIADGSRDNLVLLPAVQQPYGDDGIVNRIRFPLEHLDT